MASTPHLSGHLVDEAKAVIKLNPKKYRGGAAYIAGTLTGIEVALRVLEKYGGKLPKGHLAEVHDLAMKAWGKIK